MLQFDDRFFKGCFRCRILQEHLGISELPLRVYYFILSQDLVLMHVEQLSQELFNLNGTLYNQTLILNSNFEVDPTLLDEVGLVCHLFDFRNGLSFTIARRSPIMPDPGSFNCSPLTLGWAPPSPIY